MAIKQEQIVALGAVGVLGLLFATSESRAAARAGLEGMLADYAGKKVSVVIRTPKELQATLDSNPFADKEPKFTAVIMINDVLPDDAISGALGRADEDVQPGANELYVHYPSGMGRSKLRFPALPEGTARNVNTIRKMVDLANA